MIKFISSLLIFFSLSSCHSKQTGFLLIHSLMDGDFEVYKIHGDSTLQFVSNQIGQLNKKLNLQAGSYLILGDCSYQLAMIHPDKTTELIAHSLVFIPPMKAEPGDLFSIQCNRHPQTHPPQSINERFELTLLSNEMEMLVGMKPLKLHLKEDTFKSPQRVMYPLSALRVANPSLELPVEVPPYFVSPSDGQLAVTQSQSFGKWQFLLPGNYTVSVNGTQKEISLHEKESVSLDPAYLQFSISRDVNMSRYQAIKGEPYTIEINEKPTFNINTIYPLISETVQYRLEGALKSETLTLTPKELTKLTLRSVEVSLNCGPWEWECLGKRDVNLYEADSASPFLIGSTDLPILFLKESVQFEIEGAQSLRYKIPKAKQDSIFETGQLLLKPKPSYRHGQLSLLIRVEGNEGAIEGQSYDIPYTRDTRINLVTGTYNLNHFIMMGTHTQTGGTQMSSRTAFSIKKGDVKEMGFEYFLPEEKLDLLGGKNVRSKTTSRDRPFLAF